MTRADRSGYIRRETDLRPAGILVLGLVLIFAWADRMLITVAIEAIKHDFLLSDFQMGLLLGQAFAIFYAAFALPIARWADIGHRPRIIALALSVWSVLTRKATFKQIRRIECADCGLTMTS